MEASRTWDLTINNYSDEDLDMLRRWGSEVSRLVVAKEVGDNNTPHLQVRVTFRRVYRFNAVKKLVPKAHIEKTLAAQDSLYCMKQGSEVVIDINNKKQGQRSDLDAVIEDIQNGCTEEQLYRNHPKAMVRYGRGILEVKAKLHPIKTVIPHTLTEFPNWQPITDWSKSHILWGPPGIGKTCFAKAHFVNPLMVSHKDDLRLFNPEQHDGIIFDDMDFRHWPRTAQIHIVDQDDGRSIDVKYGTAYIPAHTKKVFTTNQTAGFIFEVCCDRLDPAIERRVTVTEVSQR